MRVGILTPVAGFQGGIERLSFEVARGLRARGHRVELLPGGAPGRDADTFASAFDPHQPARPLDVILAQKILDPAALAPLGDTPVVLAAHDHDHTCPRAHRYLPLNHEPCHRPPGAACVAHGCVVVRRRGGPLPLSLVNPFARRSALASLASRGAFLACSAYVAARLIDAGAPPSRVRVARPSPPDDDRPTAPRPAAPRLLFVGQLLRGKGVEHAIDALAWMPDASLDIVGDGPSRPDLEARARTIAPGRVRFHGFVPGAGVGAFYDQASVVLVPSHWPEPFGMTGIEAMRRARPVIGADHGGIPEWLPDGVGGFLFAPGDPRALASAARRALADPGLGDRALAFVRERFPHERYLDEVEAALRACAGPGPLPDRS